MESKISGSPQNNLQQIQVSNDSAVAITQHSSLFYVINIDAFNMDVISVTLDSVERCIVFWALNSKIALVELNK